ncbi:uncharacterized protein STEHIDRAFT_21556, partial [Stereum hirsutum FP-91666 SS1]|uniref:uncharacterized protein n=1 Tax=Stereum hirsutum (strain FP-91666) TaxID=721885 RepID=UPI0004449DC2
PHILVHMGPDTLARYVKGYRLDPEYKSRYKELQKGENVATWDAGKRFYKDERGLLFFRDANFQPRLCVPISERGTLLAEAHESPFETAHAGA